MTHLTPEEVEAVTLLRHEHTQFQNVPWGKALALAADAIEQRAALPGLVVVLREALEEQYAVIDEGFLTGSSVDAWECNECGEFGDKVRHLNHTDECNQGKILKALALDIPHAAAQVAEWREKSELLDLISSSTRYRLYGLAMGYELVEDGRSAVINGSAKKCIERIKSAKEASDE